MVIPLVSKQAKESEECFEVAVHLVVTLELFILFPKSGNGLSNYLLICPAAFS
jgi:hypothetical protein